MFDWTATRTLPQRRETPVQWVRVGRELKCPICEKDDWCTVAADKTIACCMRVESQQPCRNGGWIHELDSTVKIDLPVTAPREYDLDAPAEWEKYKARRSSQHFGRMAKALGLSIESMRKVGFIWSLERSALAVPMYTADREICGIRLRYKWGAKRSVTGGRNGLFIPSCVNAETGPHLWICEGPTDLAAMIDMGVEHCIATPSAMGGGIDLSGFIQTLPKVKSVTFIADMDPVGIRGAKRNAEALKGLGYEAKVVLPPAKDLRVWMQLGASHTDLLGLEARDEMDQG